MARRTSIYSQPLKDINRDSKRNFGDTWLGDLIGADGKAGVQGPGMRESMRGARRGSEQTPARNSGTQSRPTSSTGGSASSSEAPRGVVTPEVEVRNLSPYMGGRGDAMAEAERRRTDAMLSNAEAAIGRAESGEVDPNLTLKGYTWDQVSTGNALGRLRAGLPAYMTYNEFVQAALSERRNPTPEPKSSGGRNNARTGIARVGEAVAAGETTQEPSSRSRGRNGARTGYAKGGLVQKSKPKANKAAKTTSTRKGHTDMRQKGLFK